MRLIIEKIANPESRKKCNPAFQGPQ